MLGSHWSEVCVLVSFNGTMEGVSAVSTLGLGCVSHFLGKMRGCAF